MIKTNVLLVAVLLTSACASRPIAPAEESLPPAHGEAKSTAGHTVAEAAKGRFGSAALCALPTAAGLYGGPIGLAITGIGSFYCPPFGFAIAALAGGMRGASQ